MRVEYEVEDHVAVITLNHGKLNTITPSMHRQMYDIIVEFMADPDVHCGILRGAGERAFSAGDDLKVEMRELSPPSAQLMSELTPAHRRAGAGESWEWAREVAQLERFKPIVGAVRGWCLGGGLGCLLTLSDIRIASPDAKFGLPEIAYGMGGAGGLMRLSRVIPRTAAMQMLLTGEPIDAQEARRIHLINEVVPGDQLDARAMAIARMIASHPPMSIRLEMESTLSTENMTPHEALRYGDRIYQLQRLALGQSEQESFQIALKKKGK
jgi:enoyl-CoA hydratase/carnithine racemase